MSRQGTPQRPNGGAPQGKIQPFKLVLLGKLLASLNVHQLQTCSVFS